MNNGVIPLIVDPPDDVRLTHRAGRKNQIASPAVVARGGTGGCTRKPADIGAFATAVDATGPIRLLLTPVDLSFIDAVRHYYPNSNLDLQAGVTIGIIDTGCGPHADLNIVGGRNTVTGEPATAFQDGGLHGTHVAGLIGAGGTPPTGPGWTSPGTP